MKKAIIVLFSFVLALAIPSFAKNEGAFVKNEDICLKVAEFVRGCFDIGIKDIGIKNQCESLSSILYAIQNEFVKRNISLEVFDSAVDLCVAVCIVAEKNRDTLIQDLEKNRDTVFTSIYNICIHDFFKENKKKMPPTRNRGTSK